jgi:hypothetical protein
MQLILKNKYHGKNANTNYFGWVNVISIDYQVVIKY